MLRDSTLILTRIIHRLNDYLALPASSFAKCSLVVVIAALVLPSAVRGDALIVTQAMKASTILEVYIEKDTITAALEIGVEDLRTFRNLLPQPIYERFGFPPQPFASRIEQFSREGLVLSSIVVYQYRIHWGLTFVEVSSLIQRHR